MLEWHSVEEIEGRERVSRREQEIARGRTNPGWGDKRLCASRVSKGDTVHSS
jgi:hypothetical protein